MKDFLKFTWDVGFLVLSLCHSPRERYKAKGLYWRNPVRYFGVTRLDCWHKQSPCFSHSLLCKCDKLCLPLLISCNSSVIFPILQNKWVKGDDSSLPSVLVTATWSSGSSSGLPCVQQRVMKMIKVLEYLTLGEDETRRENLRQICSMCKNTWWGSGKENRTKFFSIMLSVRTRGNEHKLKLRKLHVSIKDNFCSMKLVEYWNKLLREIEEPPSFELLKTLLDQPLWLSLLWAQMLY